MDWDTIKEDIIRLSNENIILAEEYSKIRKVYAKNKYELDIILASELPKIRAIRASIGYDMSLLVLLEIVEPMAKYNEIRGIYEGLLKSEAEFKGLERIIEANQAKLSLYQSILKYIKEI